jgi:hypothetical protein
MSNNTINEIKQVLIKNLNSDDYCWCNCIEILNKYMNIKPYNNDTLHELLINEYNNDLLAFTDSLNYRTDIYNYNYSSEDIEFINMNSRTLYNWVSLRNAYLHLLEGIRSNYHTDEDRLAEDILRTIDNLDDILLAINEEYGLITL